jgi:tryptophanyl-tRNA synthetase
VHFDWENQPGVTSLLQMLSIISGRSQDDVNKEWTGCERYGDLKKAVAETVKSFLVDFQKRFDEIDDAELESKLRENEAKMTETANATLFRVQQAVGLRPKG